MVDGFGIEEGELEAVANCVLIILVQRVDGGPANGENGKIGLAGNLLFFENAKWL